MQGFVKKKVLLIEDNAGWHRSQKVNVPEGMTVEYLPAYSPELQPAERLWCLVDEPLVNQYFETIDESDAAREQGVSPMSDCIKTWNKLWFIVVIFSLK
ncbi:MAG: hypothetical protein F6K65_18430 [Moorea sp. SIO3C2]|nr:hypothetical protein [Moorena sp. SIO3C2]